MSDPDTDPGADLLTTPQDAELAAQPHVRLGTVLSLLRAAAGARGDASVGWSAGGFTFLLGALREADGPLSPVVSTDPEAPELLRALLREAVAPEV